MLKLVVTRNYRSLLVRFIFSLTFVLLFFTVWLVSFFTIASIVPAGEASYTQGWQAVLSVAGAGISAALASMGAVLLFPRTKPVRRQLCVMITFGALTPFALAALYSFDRMQRGQWWLVACTVALCCVVLLVVALEPPDQAHGQSKLP